MKFLPVFVSQLPALFYTRRARDLLILATVVEGSPSVGYPVQQAKLHLLSTGAERKIKCRLPSSRQVGQREYTSKLHGIRYVWF